jgi:serpin B
LGFALEWTLIKAGKWATGLRKGREMIAAYNNLGQAVFRTLAQSADNIVISPLSIGVTLAMGFAAAAGETAEEMARVLKFDAARPIVLKANADLLRHFGEENALEGPRLRLANALVLTQHGESVAESFRELLADSFAAEIFQADIASVNQWVARKTGGKIKQALNSLPQDDIAVLINAIYFKAPWAKEFDPALTYDGRFFLSEHDEVDVKMMHAVGDYAIVPGAGYRAVRLPYKPSSLGMIIVLPDEIEGANAVIGAFDIAELARLRAEFERATPCPNMFELPRFCTQSEASLKTALQQAGMEFAFDWTRADFSGMTERPPAEIPVAISDVLHSALIEVSEEGTEAAGATLKMFHIGGSSPSFIVDRPFLFFIVDEATGTIVFQGRIVDPR